MVFRASRVDAETSAVCIAVLWFGPDATLLGF